MFVGTYVAFWGYTREGRCIEIHMNLETSGTFSWDRWHETLRLLDLIYFDIKILGAERLVGGGCYPVEFRMALVPGFTDTPENVTDVARRLHEIGRPSLHLFP